MDQGALEAATCASSVPSLYLTVYGCKLRSLTWKGFYVERIKWTVFDRVKIKQCVPGPFPLSLLKDINSLLFRSLSRRNQ